MENKKPSHKKNTPFKNTEANSKGIFSKRVFFSATKKNFFPSLLF